MSNVPDHPIDPYDFTQQMQNYVAEQSAIELASTPPNLTKPNLDGYLVWTQNDFTTRGFSVPFWRVLQKYPDVMRNPNVSVFETFVGWPGTRRGVGFVVLPDLRSGTMSAADIIDSWYDTLTAKMTAFQRQIYDPEIMRLLSLTAQGAGLEFTRPHVPPCNEFVFYLNQEDFSSSSGTVFVEASGSNEWVQLNFSADELARLQRLNSNVDGVLIYAIPFSDLSSPILAEASRSVMVGALDTAEVDDAVALTTRDGRVELLSRGWTEPPPTAADSFAQISADLAMIFALAAGRREVTPGSRRGPIVTLRDGTEVYRPINPAREPVAVQFAHPISPESPVLPASTSTSLQPFVAAPSAVKPSAYTAETAALIVKMLTRSATTRLVPPPPRPPWRIITGDVETIASRSRYHTSTTRVDLWDPPLTNLVELPPPANDGSPTSPVPVMAALQQLIKTRHLKAEDLEFLSLHQRLHLLEILFIEAASPEQKNNAATFMDAIAAVITSIGDAPTDSTTDPAWSVIVELAGIRDVHERRAALTAVAARLGHVDSVTSPFDEADVLFAIVQTPLVDLREIAQAARETSVGYYKSARLTEEMLATSPVFLSTAQMTTRLLDEGFSIEDTEKIVGNVLHRAIYGRQDKKFGAPYATTGSFVIVIKSATLEPDTVGLISTDKFPDFLARQGGTLGGYRILGRVDGLNNFYAGNLSPVVDGLIASRRERTELETQLTARLTELEDQGTLFFRSTTNGKVVRTVIYAKRRDNSSVALFKTDQNGIYFGGFTRALAQLCTPKTLFQFQHRFAIISEVAGPEVVERFLLYLTLRTVDDQTVAKDFPHVASSQEQIPFDLAALRSLGDLPQYADVLGKLEEQSEVLRQYWRGTLD